MNLNKVAKCLLLCVSALQAIQGYTSEISTQEAASVGLGASDPHPFSQTFSVQAGTFRPKAISLSNSAFTYNYAGDSLNSFMVEPGWSLKLFHLLGAVSIEENIGISSFKGSIPGKSDSLSLLMLTVDTRIKHSWEWFPVKAVIPFVEGGYQYAFLSQSGPSDFESAQGSVGNIVGAAGFDLWVNAMFGQSTDYVNKYNAIPFFITAKVNHIISRGSDVDLGSTSFFAGLSVGI